MASHQADASAISEISSRASTPLSHSAPFTPPRRASMSSTFSTPATSYFDSPSFQYSSTHTSISPSPIAPSYHSSSDIDHLAQNPGDPTARQIEAKFPKIMPAANTEFQGNAMADIGPFYTIDSSSEVKLGQLIGSGQWSNVYVATLAGCQSTSQAQREERSLNGIWESHSRENVTRGSTSSGRKVSKLFAAKVGSGRSSIKVLQNEARLLSFLMERPLTRDYVVEFFGYDARKQALVMDYVPITLEDFVTSSSGKRGPEDDQRLLKKFTNISRKLIRGLHYIHQANIIHGDIKPSNILLRRERQPRDFSRENTREQGREQDVNAEGFQPVYCDFSAARLDEPQSIPSESAGTYDYMAPELFSRSKPDNFPTQSSDVYALGITLIYLVIGKSPYDGAQNVFMRRAMAMSGTPLDFIGTDDKAASKWEKARFGTWVVKAVQAQASARWTSAEWSQWAEKTCTGGE